MYTQRIGKFGEDEAENFLRQKGYKILERNFSCRRGEIDIIALDKGEIVFLEIKARVSLKYGYPSEAVTKYKLNHIYKTAEYYLYTRKLQNRNTRIDVIEVYIKNNQVIINHLKQVV